MDFNINQPVPFDAEKTAKIAVDLVSEGILTKPEALLRVNAEDLNQLLHPRLDPKATKKMIAKGLPASPGALCGQIVFLRGGNMVG
jgi:pyruvate,orthophosphate dikinase